MMWLDFARKTPRTLFDHLRNLGVEAPQWLIDEPEMKNLDHVVSKGTRCVLIYKAMLAAAPTPPVFEDRKDAPPVQSIPRERLALNVRNQDCHKAADAFWKYWNEYGETHKHGYYESTWGAINQALRTVGVVEHEYRKADAAMEGK